MRVAGGGVGGTYPPPARQPRCEYWGEDRSRHLPPGQRPMDESRQGSAGGAPSARSIAAPRILGGGLIRRLPPRWRPQDEGRRGECRSRSLPRDDRRAANIGWRIAGGDSLPDKGHGTRVSGGNTGGAPSTGTTAAPRIFVGGSITASLSPMEARVRGSAEGVPEAQPPPNRPSRRECWGGIDRGVSLLDGAGGGPEAHPPPGHPPRHKYWGEDRRRRSPP